MILILDHNKCFEFPNVIMKDVECEYDLTNIEDDLSELLSNYDPGLYEIEFESFDEFKGQRGEYGSWEVPPYRSIETISVVKIGDISKEYETPMYINIKYKELLKQRSENIQQWVNRQKHDDEKLEYLLMPMFHQLSFCTHEKSNTGSFFMTNPIKYYPLELTTKNINFIEDDLLKFFNLDKME